MVSFSELIRLLPQALNCTDLPLPGRGTGNVLDLMLHPENRIHAWQHPQRSRGVERGSGLNLFKNGVAACE